MSTLGAIMGPTPPNVYELALREEPFHGVRALRLTPVGAGNMFGREGILAHSYMLGPNGQSNGCVSFSDYEAFLNAFLRGDVHRLVVVEHSTARPAPRPPRVVFPRPSTRFSDGPERSATGTCTSRSAGAPPAYGGRHEAIAQKSARPLGGSAQPEAANALHLGGLGRAELRGEKSRPDRRRRRCRPTSSSNSPGCRPCQTKRSMNSGCARRRAAKKICERRAGVY